MHFEYAILTATRKGIVVSVDGDLFDNLVRTPVVCALNEMGAVRWDTVGMIIIKDENGNEKVQYLLKREVH